MELGLISCDRHSAYKKFSRMHPGIVLSFCWAHQRRDFLNLANDYPTLEAWAMPGVDRIGMLFDRYEQRAQAAFNSAEYRNHNTPLRNWLRGMARERNRCLQDPQLPAPAIKILQSMQRHWQGLREFVRRREVPPDSKNFYGSGSEWSGQLAAMMFSLLMTMKRWQINPRTWLSDYLHACAAAGNRVPSDLNPYLPWSMAASRRVRLRAAYTPAQRPEPHRVDTS